jgi:hypothetical protein
MRPSFAKPAAPDFVSVAKTKLFHVEHLLSATYAFPERVNRRLELLFNTLFDVFSAQR